MAHSELALSDEGQPKVRRGAELERERRGLWEVRGAHITPALGSQIQNICVLNNRSKRVALNSVMTRGFAQRGGRERKEKTLDTRPEKNPELSLASSSKCPHLCGSLGVIGVPAAPLQRLSPTDSAVRGFSATPPPAHCISRHLWVPRQHGPLLTRAHFPKVSEPTYQEHMLSFIISGQHGIPPQHISFQTVATVKVGGIIRFTPVFHMVSFVLQSSARLD